MNRLIAEGHLLAIEDESIFFTAHTVIDQFGFNTDTLRITANNDITVEFGKPISTAGTNTAAPDPGNTPSAEPSTAPTSAPKPTTEPTPTPKPTPVIPEGAIVVDSPEDFQAIGNDLAGTYYLTEDIDLSGISWTAIGQTSGSSGNKFTGRIIGNGHVISGLNWTSNSGRGLIFINAGTIEDIIVVAPNVTVKGESGIICVQNEGTISRCGVNGNITVQTGANYWYTGGITGYNLGGTIDQCWSNVSITATQVYSYSWYGTGLTAPNYNGGISGVNAQGGVISNCLVFGSIEGPRSAGITGMLDGGTITNTFSMSKINDNDQNYGSNWTKHLWGEVNGTNTRSGNFYLKGLMYKNGRTTELWDTYTGVNEANGSYGRALVPDTLLAQTFIDAGWDTDIWNLADGEYPTLKNAPVLEGIEVKPPVAPVL